MKIILKLIVFAVISAVIEYLTKKYLTPKIDKYFQGKDHNWKWRN